MKGLLLLLWLDSPVWKESLYTQCFPGGSVVKNRSANVGEAREAGSVLGSGRSPGGGHGNPFLYSCLENHTDRGAWWAIVCGVTESNMIEHTSYT